RRGAGRRSLVRSRAADERARTDRAPVPRGGNALVEGVHSGARAMRRGRRPASPARDGPVARLAAPAHAVRRLLARAAQPTDSVWIRLSGQTPERTGLGDGGAGPAAERQSAEPAERRLLRPAAVARTVPARHRSSEVPRRTRRAVWSDDEGAHRHLDEGDR